MSRMGLVVRPLSCFGTVAINPGLLSPIFAGRPNPNPQKKQQHLPYASPPTSLDFQSRGIRLVPIPLLQPELQESAGVSVTESDKSRNQKKREARQAVQWGMELATFSAPQIKRILRVASLGQEVYNAIVLVKTFGSDVREGKRRQYNYIGRLLREASKPDLLGDLIQATKDGDQSKLQQLSGAEACIIEVEEEYAEETECEEEEESNFSAVASRWSDGLIDKDSDITNEVYSIHSVEFDRQELRKLVRRVHNIQNQEFSEENKAAKQAALAGAKTSLNRFLRSLAKQMEYDSELN